MTDAAALVRSYCDAWMAGDVMGVLATYHDDLTLVWPGRHPFAGTHQGQTAAIQALLDLQALTNRQPIEVLDILGSTHGAIAVVRERWTADDQAIEITRALHYTVRNDKLHTCTIYEFDQPQIDDFLAASDETSVAD